MRRVTHPRDRSLWRAPLPNTREDGHALTWPNTTQSPHKKGERKTWTSSPSPEPKEPPPSHISSTKHSKPRLACQSRSSRPWASSMERMKSTTEVSQRPPRPSSTIPSNTPKPTAAPLSRWSFPASAKRKAARRACRLSMVFSHRFCRRARFVGGILSLQTADCRALRKRHP